MADLESSTRTATPGVSIVGTTGDDVIVGTSGDDLIDGWEGNDTISGMAGNDSLFGWSGNDVIDGGDGDDWIFGEGGTDILTGGAGNDIFGEFDQWLNGDTITDFSIGDVILIRDAHISTFSFSLVGELLTFTGAQTSVFTGGSMTLTGASGAVLAASAHPEGGVQIVMTAGPAPPPDARNDFNGDGRSDILWRHDMGTIADWLGNANGGFTPNNPSVTNVPDYWQVAGTGDFNGDGRDDLLWRGEAGEFGNWLAASNGSFTYNAAAGIVTIPHSWQVEGVGDFNGDGRDDVLWRSTSGEIGNWLGSASGAVAYNAAAGVVAVDNYWQIAGVGDFNGDGRDDILWRGGGGEVGSWSANSSGGFAYNAAAGVAAAPTSWHIVGIGDFNGDNRDDILWRSNIGEVGTWLANANGSFTANNAQVVMVSTAWHIADVGDFNGDNIDDLLWRHDNGQMTDWLGQISGFWLENNGNALAHVPVDWTIQANDTQWV